MNGQNQFLLYPAPDGAVKVDVFFKDETVWLTQKALAELFGVKVPAINKHLKNIFEAGELVEASVVSILETTAADGKNYQTRYHNLDAIIAAAVDELTRDRSAMSLKAANRAEVVLPFLPRRKRAKKSR